VSVDAPEDLHAQFGALSRVGPQQVIGALAEVTVGRIVDLEVTRFPGMPSHAAHPELQVLAYRTPRGGRVSAPPGWEGASNPHQQGIITDLIIGTSHTGTHVDSLAHFTSGPRDSWFNDESADDFLSDFGPTRHDASCLPPVITRGLLIDLPRFLGCDILPPGYAISASDCESALQSVGATIRDGDAVLIRTGYMRDWPDSERLESSRGAGLSLDAARWLADAGAVVIGTDNPGFESLPSGDPERPRLVHPFLLSERGIPIIELLNLEELACNGFATFAFVLSAPTYRGATAAVVRPLALI
jgi:kynurenine formamidase